MNRLDSILKRLANLRDHINDFSPNDMWILNSLEPKIQELLKSNITEEEESRIITSINQVINAYEFRYNTQFENKLQEYNHGEFCPQCLAEYIEKHWNLLAEAEYKGRKVQLGKPFLTPDGPKKRSVYVKNAKGNVVKVNFGQKGVKIKKNIPARRKSFRARHGCDKNPGPRWKAKYWSCKFW